MVHDEKLDKNKIHSVNFITFLLGFSQAILVYILSSYFQIASGTENVGVFYFISYGITLLILLNMHHVVRRLGKSNVLHFSILISLAAMFVLTLAPPSLASIILVIVYIAFISVSLVATDIVLESFSVDLMSGRIRGLHLTLLNAGFLIGPFLSTRILGKFDFHGIFVFLLILNSLILVFAISKIRAVNHDFKEKLNPLQIVRKVLERKDLRRIYYISFTLEFFYALMVIYTPIYLRDLGISWSEIGIIFTIMLIPFVVLQYPAGIVADKKMGEKELLIGSLILMGLATLSIFFVGNGNIAVWSIILLLTRIGASLIEILRDSYFYKRIDGHDVDLINFFRTAVPVSYLVAALISTPILIFFPTKAIFLIVAFASFLGLYPAFRLKDNKCEKEIIGRSC